MDENKEEKMEGIEVSYDVMPNIDSAKKHQDSPKEEPKPAPPPKQDQGESPKVLPGAPDFSDSQKQSGTEDAPLPPPTGKKDIPFDSNVETKPHSNRNLIIIFSVIIVLGVIAYFGITFFGNRDLDNELADEPIAVVEEPALPAAWLEKYFDADCDESICGPNADPDNDGLKNLKELDSLTDPNLADTDYDGIADIDELQIYNTDPIVADTDGDGFEDGIEIRNGYNPNIDSSLEASVLEIQIFEENIEIFGLHESTSNFLLLEKMVKTFTADDGSITEQYYFAWPSDWGVLEGPSFILLSDTQERAFVTIGLLSHATTSDIKSFRELNKLAAFESIRSTEKKIGQKEILVDEYFSGTEDENDRSRVLYTVLRVQDSIFRVQFVTEANLWDEYRLTAENITKGIMIWPF